MRFHKLFAKWGVAFASIGLLLAGTPLGAQEAAASAVAEADPPPVDPRTIPVAAFASRNSLSGAKLSPDGSKFAHTLRTAEKFWLVVVDVATLEEVKRVSLGVEDNFKWFGWAGSQRILTSRMVSADTRRFTARFSRLVLYDLNDSEWRYIGFDEQGLEGDDILHTDPAGNYIVLSVSRSEGIEPEVWHFPLDGSGADAAELLQQKDGEIDEWWADETGVVRFGKGWTRGSSTMIYYRSSAAEEFRRIVKLERRDDRLDNWDVIGLRAGVDTGYALVDGEDGKRILRELDYTTGTLGKVVLEEPDWSIQSVITDRSHELVGLRYTDDAPKQRWLAPELADLHERLEKVFGEGQADIISYASDFSALLVLQSSASNPGSLFIYSPGDKRVVQYAQYRPELDPQALSSVKAVNYSARDGVEIRAYLTLPIGQPEQGLPLVIMPHGGPFGVRDTMTFDPWVQLLASRGYAVLQPNYRGSGGYGEAFERLGDGEIGRGMQDDLDDAMDWAIAQGIADPARVCLVGASYGGYAALWGVIRNPERYRCAVSFAGVTDWKDMLQYDRNFIARDYYREFKERVRGDRDEGGDLYDLSPQRRANDLTRPILLAHGTKDRVVPIAQYLDMVKATRRSKQLVEKLTVPDGHSLSDDANRELFFEAMVAFLAKHNPAFVGADAKAAPAEAE